MPIGYTWWKLFDIPMCIINSSVQQNAPPEKQFSENQSSAMYANTEYIIGHGQMTLDFGIILAKDARALIYMK